MLSNLLRSISQRVPCAQRELQAARVFTSVWDQVALYPKLSENKSIALTLGKPQSLNICTHIPMQTLCASLKLGPDKSKYKIHVIQIDFEHVHRRLRFVRNALDEDEGRARASIFLSEFHGRKCKVLASASVQD